MQIEDRLASIDAKLGQLVTLFEQASGVKTPAPGTVAISGKPEKPVKAAAPAVKPPSALTYDDNVKPALASLMSKKGKGALSEFLKTLGVKTGQELKPEQFAVAIEGADKAAAAEEMI